MMPARLPQTDTVKSAVTALRPSLNRLTNAWAKACATHPDVAALAATAPRMRGVSPASGDWVLQGLTQTGGAICACITPENDLRIIATGPAHIATTLAIPLAELEGEA